MIWGRLGVPLLLAEHLFTPSLSPSRSQDSARVLSLPLDSQLPFFSASELVGSVSVWIVPVVPLDSQLPFLLLNSWVL